MEHSRESQGPLQSPTSDRPRSALGRLPNRPSPCISLRPARGFVRFLYSSNPFYILSADLVFVGLRISFGSGGPASTHLGPLVRPGGLHAAAGDDGLLS